MHDQLCRNACHQDLSTGLIVGNVLYMLLWLLPDRCLRSTSLHVVAKDEVDEVASLGKYCQAHSRVLEESNATTARSG